MCPAGSFYLSPLSLFRGVLPDGGMPPFYFDYYISCRHGKHHGVRYFFTALRLYQNGSGQERQPIYVSFIDRKSGKVLKYRKVRKS